MTKFDKIFLTIIYLPLVVILFFLIGWWGSLSFANESAVPYFALSGLAIGAIISLLTLPQVLRIGYRLSNPSLFLIYIFYSIGIFGFFMGVPVFNIIPAIFAAVFICRKIITQNIADEKSSLVIKKATLFCTLVLLVICGSSAYLALRDPYTAANLEGILNIGFDLSRLEIWAIILAGGIALLLLQYHIMRIIFSRLLKKM